jgi:hypothetical protein
VTKKASPPGWEPHKIVSRVDGWVIDPENEDRIPPAVAELIVQQLPQPDRRDAVAIIRARMLARQIAYDQSKKVLGHV